MFVIYMPELMVRFYLHVINVLIMFFFFCICAIYVSELYIVLFVLYMP